MRSVASGLKVDVGGPCGDVLVKEDGVGLGLVVWWETREHLEDEHAEGVPIDRLDVLLLAICAREFQLTNLA